MHWSLNCLRLYGMLVGNGNETEVKNLNYKVILRLMEII